MCPGLQLSISTSLFGRDEEKKSATITHTNREAIVYNKSEEDAINMLGCWPKRLGGSENEGVKTKQHFGVL